MSVSGSWIHCHTLYSSSAVCHTVFVAVCVFYISPLPPPSFLPHLLLLCVCLWLWQLSSTPERDRLIIDCLFLPGLSTSSAPDYCIQYGDLMVLLLSGFFFLCFLLLCPCHFSLLHSTEVSSAIPLCFACVLLSPSTLDLFDPPSLPAYLPGIHLPAPVCTINLHFTTSCLRRLHLGPKIQSQP